MVKNCSRRGGPLGPAAAAVLLATLTFGVAACGPATTSASTTQTQQSTSSSPAAPTTAAPPPTVAPSSPAPAPPAKPAIQGEVLPASAPVSLTIPDIGLTTNLMTLAREANGEAEVPPEAVGSPAGWYKHSPTPGELGPSVILGHVNATNNPEGVFFRLHELTEGEEFSVTRADGSVAVFAVDRSEIFKKNAFPTLAVYGNTDRAEIRLITCDGYEASSGEFTENFVVYAHLVSSNAG